LKNNNKYLEEKSREIFLTDKRQWPRFEVSAAEILVAIYLKCRPMSVLLPTELLMMTAAFTQRTFNDVLISGS
jgi:hypothetical protein